MLPICPGSRALKWKDFDKKELVFLTENKPARRFLYFRFLITYLNAKKSQNTPFHLRLLLKPKTTLARNISGLELPPTLLQHTFEHAPKDKVGGRLRGFYISLRSLLGDATVESTKKLEAQDSRDEDDEEDDDDAD
ncbi:hypothetical protein DTO271G3_4063 [Paecilomyces variotii]|nr:hypothetical protein DTO271G3_4063 [Paecilomyces variotii]